MLKSFSEFKRTNTKYIHSGIINNNLCELEIHKPKINTPTKYVVTHHRFLKLIWLDAANEEGLAQVECPHEHLQGALELAAQGGRALPGLHALNTSRHQTARQHPPDPMRSNWLLWMHSMGLQPDLYICGGNEIGK